MLSDEELALLIDYLAYNPAAGDLIPGAGGVRKLRWGLQGRGKRGGARVIYFYHDAEMPLFGRRPTRKMCDPICLKPTGTTLGL